MKVKVIEKFTDKYSKIEYNVGDTAEFQDERAKELINYKLVEKVSGGKNELTDDIVDTRLKAIKDKETDLEEREKKLNLAESALSEREKKFDKALEEADTNYNNKMGSLDERSLQLDKREAELNESISNLQKEIDERVVELDKREAGIVARETALTDQETKNSAKPAK
ncbi:MAG: hypothetical protein ACK5M3_05595 [Dysgonomonas sp.]